MAIDRNAPQQPQGPRTNDQIRISPLRVVDADGTMLGVISRDEAFDIAMRKGLDLVEVAPQERPPVCRIMDFGKFKYEQAKKNRKGKSHQHQTKELRVRPQVGQHDLDFKIKHAREFLEGRDKVLVVVQFRGREMAHMENGLNLVNRIAEAVSDIAKVERMPSRDGRRITALLAPR